MLDTWAVCQEEAWLVSWPFLGQSGAISISSVKFIWDLSYPGSDRTLQEPPEARGAPAGVPLLCSCCREPSESLVFMKIPSSWLQTRSWGQFPGGGKTAAFSSEKGRARTAQRKTQAHSLSHNKSAINCLPSKCQADAMAFPLFLFSPT